MRAIGRVIATWIVAAAPPLIAAEPDAAGLAGFELKLVQGMPCDWRGGPADTIGLDTRLKHAGERSLRILRDANRGDEFSAVSRAVDIDAPAAQVQLRGWLRSSGTGHASLWLRQDGNGKVVSFRGGEAIAANGQWIEQTLTAEVDPGAHQLVFGVRFVGTGVAWADDVQLTVDGQPLPMPEACLPTALDRDTQFDAGSGMSAMSLDARQLEALTLSIRIWGFLKYHHPALTSGTRHWDYDLLRHLPRILEARSAAMLNQEWIAWIDSLGPVEPCRACVDPDDGWALRPKLTWMDARPVSAALRRRLRAIHAARVPDQQFFVRFAPGIGNAVFESEPAYDRIKLPDAGFQILAVARFWNMIEYWFPYRDLIDEDWDAVLRDSLKHAAAAPTAEAFVLELAALVARVDDGHANLYTATIRPPAGDCQLPVTLRVVEGEFVVGTLAAATDDARQFLPGDVIVSLGERTPQAIVAEASRYIGASNDAARLQSVARAFTRGACGPVKVAVRRDEPREILAHRVPLKTLDLASQFANDRAGETLQRLSPEVAYLKLSSIAVADIPRYLEAVADARALIVDIRNYPAQFVVFALGGALVESQTPFARFSLPDASNPGAFRFGESISLTPQVPPFAGRIAVLVDEGSMSQAEYTAMALGASPRSLVVGSQTAGADGNVSPIPLPAGMRAGMSGIGVFYPDRTPTQQRGVRIDVPCTPTIAGLRAGRDEVLECAIAALEK